MNRAALFAWATSSTTIQGVALILGAVSAALGKQITWDAAFAAAVPGLVLMAAPQHAGQKAMAQTAAAEAVAMSEASKRGVPPP